MSRVQDQVSGKNSGQQPDNSWVGELVRTVAFAILLALGIRTFVAEARWIPTGSMEPTLHGSLNQWEADKVIVDKVSYNFSGPQRGDIVVFSPTDELQREKFDEAFIKRVIALPGEKVELRSGKVYINNKPLDENQYLSAQQETATNVCLSSPQQAYLSRTVTIPANSYLVLGDNRTNSYDSRCWGVVPRDRIIGRAIVRWWPVNKFGGLYPSTLYNRSQNPSQN